MTRRAALAVLAMLALVSAYEPDKVTDGPLNPNVRNLGAAGRQPPPDLGANSLRVRIAPSFSHNFFAIDFAPQPKDCLTPHGGTIDEVDRDEPRFCRDVLVTYALIARPGIKIKVATGRWTFHIPVADYRALAEGIDMRLDAWRGIPIVTDAKDGLQWITVNSDGTGVGVERARDGKIRSVANNDLDSQAPNNPAAFAKSEVQRLLLIYGPSGKVPRDGDWNIRDRGRLPNDPCLIAEFATPDPDGYGVGKDACAKALKARRP